MSVSYYYQIFFNYSKNMFTDLSSSFHLTSAPNASEIALRGTRVLPFVIFAGTSILIASEFL